MAAAIDLSDEQSWSLDAFLQEADHGVSVLAQDHTRGSDMTIATESEYVYGRATERIRASLAAEPLHDDMDDDLGDDLNINHCVSDNDVNSAHDDAANENDDNANDEHMDVVKLHEAAWPEAAIVSSNDNAFSSTTTTVPTSASCILSDATDQSSTVSPLASPVGRPSIAIDAPAPASSLAPVAPVRSYEQRIEATLTESMHKFWRRRRVDGSGSVDSVESVGANGDRDADVDVMKDDNGSETAVVSPTPSLQFTMDNVSHFDAHFGRALYLEQLGKSFVDGSGAKSLASYRMSSYHRLSLATDVLKQGWLVKRGEVVPSWHRRWFTLRRMPEGPMLTYARDDATSAPTKTIELSSTSRCLVRPKLSRDHEFRVITSTDSSRREFALGAASHFDLTEWVCAIQSAINAGNKSTFEGSEDFQRIWNECGIDGFLLRYGIRKCSARNHLQTRVLELNFAEQTITNSRRGESLTTLSFHDVRHVAVATARPNNEEFGVVLDFTGRNRSWPIYLDTREARDDLLGILQKIADKDVDGADLEQRRSRLILKTGFMERKNVAADVRVVGPHATLKGRLFVCLYENCVVLYPADDCSDDDRSARPWYVVTLNGIHVSYKDDKCMLVLGRLAMVCDSPTETRAWFNAIQSAMLLPTEIIELELRERVAIRNAFHASIARLRKLLKAKVKPEVNGPPRDQQTIELLMRTLWSSIFPDDAYTSNSDPRWLELGFQRGGPASDLRSSGLLGLYCLIYFARNTTSAFPRILERTRHGVSEGNMKNYPFAIACINVASVLTETLGFGDAGSHSAGCLPNAMATYVHLVAYAVPLSAATRARTASSTAAAAQLRDLASFRSWDEIVHEADNHVFEEIFCLLFPVLDMLFVAMGAGYMEFGQVVAAFQRRIRVIFDALPQSMDELAALAAEPCTDTLVDPVVLARANR